MKTITITCKYCNNTIEKSKVEIDRQKRRGRTDFYCSRSCAGHASCNHLAKHKNYFKEHQYIRKPDEFSPFRIFIRNAKKRQIESSMSWELDIDIKYLKDLWDQQNGKCCISGIQLKLEKKHNPYQASLDRIDSSKGYVKGNVRFVALIYNYAKNTFSDQEVIDFCKAVAKSIS